MGNCPSKSCPKNLRFLILSIDIYIIKSMESVGARIVVLGSANQDYFFMVDRLPKLGETL